MEYLFHFHFALSYSSSRMRDSVGKSVVRIFKLVKQKIGFLLSSKMVCSFNVENPLNIEFLIGKGEIVCRFLVASVVTLVGVELVVGCNQAWWPSTMRLNRW